MSRVLSPRDAHNLEYLEQMIRMSEIPSVTAHNLKAVIYLADHLVCLPRNIASAKGNTNICSLVAVSISCML